MKIRKKVEVEIEVDGKYCGDCCPFNKIFYCRIYPDDKLRTNKDGYKSKRHDRCIKEFGYE